jgi:hypothetical protein
MYGSGGGQTFLEQWSPVTRDPVTLRIKDSADKVRQDRLPRLETKINQILAVGEGKVDPQDILTGEVILDYKNQLQNARTATEVGGVYNRLTNILLEVRSRIFGTSVTEAETTAGKTPGTLRNLLPANRDNPLLLLDAASFDTSTTTITKWKKKGWAVRKASKQQLATKRTELQFIINSLNKQKAI